jgi:hypothetical protein
MTEKERRPADIRNLDVLPETESTTVTGTLQRFPSEANASATLGSTLRQSGHDPTINSRKLVRPYRTKAEMKNDAAAIEAGNMSDVSLISDFDPYESPVKEILKTLPGVMSMPDLSVGGTSAFPSKAPMKPVPPKTTVVHQ